MPSPIRFKANSRLLPVQACRRPQSFLRKFHWSPRRQQFDARRLANRRSKLVFFPFCLFLFLFLFSFFSTVLNILHAVLMLSSIQLVWPWCSLYSQSILQCAVYPISVTRRCSAHRGLAMLNDDPFRLLGCWMIVVCLGPKGLQWLCDRAMWMELHLFPPIFFCDVSDKCLVQPITEELLGCNPGSLLLCFHMAVIWTSHESWSVRYLAIVVLFWANKLQTWICMFFSVFLSWASHVSMSKDKWQVIIKFCNFPSYQHLLRCNTYLL